MKPTLTLLGFLFLYVASAQDLLLRKQTDSIVRAIDNMKTTNYEFRQDLGNYNFNMSKDQVVKITRTSKKGPAQVTEVYYIKDNSLVFSEEEEITSYAAGKVTWGGKYYFKNGVLKDYETLGHGKSEIEAWDPQKEVLLNYKRAGRYVQNYLKYTRGNKGFEIIEKKESRQVDILYDGKLLTAYCYYDSSRKPVLFPVNTVDGITVTRSYPFKMIPGERTDHPHHTGIWLNYESVNGLDFWNNSTAIPLERRAHYGTIRHEKITDKSTYGPNASLAVTTTWERPDKKVLLNERTDFYFSVRGNDLIIDRLTTLTAKDTTVVFKDVKDGMFAIRVARELELPSKEKSSYVDDKGNVTTVNSSGPGEVTGMYYSSEGLKGDSVWGTKGTWAVLSGKKQNQDISIGIIDHPKNVGYPAYWHARGYGLFAINPLGRKVFSNGKEELNFSLAPGKSVTFRYRLIVHSGSHLTEKDMKKWAEEFKMTK
jgi:hypothetical protein